MDALAVRRFLVVLRRRGIVLELDPSGQYVAVPMDPSVSSELRGLIAEHAGMIKVALSEEQAEAAALLELDPKRLEYARHVAAHLEGSDARNRIARPGVEEGRIDDG